MNPSGAYPTLDQDLWIDVRAKLTNHRISIDPATYTSKGPMAGFPSGAGMSRLTVGATIEWNGLLRFIEIVLWRDSTYDGCTSSATWWGASNFSPCDSTGLYDRRLAGGFGELVYFTAPSLGQVFPEIPTLPRMREPDVISVGVPKSYRLPLTALLQCYFGNHSELGAPTNWSSAILRGTYIGIETWGKAETAAELDNYRLYALER